MNIYDELEEIRNPNHVPKVTAQAMAQQANMNDFVESGKRKDEAAVNSMQGVRRASGLMELRGTYHADTMIDVGGIMSRVDAAISAGLVPADTLGKPLDNKVTSVDRDKPEGETKQTKSDDKPSEPFDISDLNKSVSQEIQAQSTYVETVIGEEAAMNLIGSFYDGSISPDNPNIAKLAASSGLSIEDAMSSAQDIAEAKAAPLVTSFETLLGHPIDPNHALEWLQSVATTKQEKALVRQALISGNGAMLSGLAQKYKAYNQV